MTALHPGFGDPVRDGQSVFRAIMQAMARPGRLHSVTGPASPPAPLARATAAALLTLVDAETPLWLDDAAGAARDWAAFHCGAPAAAARDAAFAVALGPVPLRQFRAGSDEEPEGSATLILQVAELGRGESLRLSGPGLAQDEVLAVAGLPPGFREEWRANGSLFPRGLDVILCAGDRLAALPRSVRIA